MSKSLQEQLMSLGLASEKAGRKKPGTSAARSQARGAKNRPRTGNGAGNSNRKSKNSASGDEEIALARAYALRQQEEKRQAETARKLKQEEDRRRRQLNKEIKAIVTAKRLNDPKAEVPRNFMYKGRIRKINLTPEQLKALNLGELGIVYMAGGYHLLAKEQVEAVRSLSEEHVPDLGGSSVEDEEHPVPDDLIW